MEGMAGVEAATGSGSRGAEDLGDPREKKKGKKRKLKEKWW